MNKQLKVAVFFGGQSFEHSISVLTGIQVIEAMDPRKYIPIPIYVDLKGEWFSGDDLLDRRNYHLSPKTKSRLSRVHFRVGKFYLENTLNSESRRGFFKKEKELVFDLAFLAFHGSNGEDGTFQGLLEILQIPYTGCRFAESAIFMNKMLTKNYCKSLDIPVLKSMSVKKSWFEKTDFCEKIDCLEKTDSCEKSDSSEKTDSCEKTNNFLKHCEEITNFFEGKFPLCVKPCHLGSSISIHKAENVREIESALIDIFRLDSDAIVEPFIQPLIEYNLAIGNFNGNLKFSAIERPIAKGSVLTFFDKYSMKNGSKLFPNNSAGLASAQRVINPPELKEEQIEKIHFYARKLFSSLNSSGFPRIDFLCNQTTGEIWLSEVNPIPGSMAYYLWEKADIPFDSLVDFIISEAIDLYERQILNFDPKFANSDVF